MPQGPPGLRPGASHRQNLMCLPKAFLILQYLFNQFPALNSFCKDNWYDFCFINLTLTTSGRVGLKGGFPPDSLAGMYFRALSQSEGQ